MIKYAVFRIKGKQYKASEGQEILVDKLDTDKPEAEILLLVNDAKVSVGNPVVSSAKTALKVVNSEEKGEKIAVFKYKAKSRYRRKMGFRPRFTRLLVEKISN